MENIAAAVIVSIATLIFSAFGLRHKIHIAPQWTKDKLGLALNIGQEEPEE